MAHLLFANIKKEDVKKLYEILREGQEYMKKRVHAIILSGIYRYKVVEIAKIVNLHPNHLRKWIRRYNEDGIDSILNSPKTGKKRQITENIKNKITEIAKISPRKLGLLFSNWTLHQLKKYLEENKIIEKISHETVRKILKETKVNLKSIK
jgi:transposase